VRAHQVIFCLCCLVGPLRAVAGRPLQRAPRGPSQPAAPLSQQLRQRIQAAAEAWSPTPLHQDPALGRAAEALLSWQPSQGPLSVEPLRLAAYRQGLTEAQLYAVALSLPVKGRSTVGPDLQRGLQKLLAGVPVNRMGIALRRYGASYRAVLAFSNRLVGLPKLPRELKQGDRLHVAVGVYKAPTAQPAAPVRLSMMAQLPDGQLLSQPLVAKAGKFHGALEVGRHPGTVKLQIIHEAAAGPQVAAQWFIGLGGPPSLQSTDPLQPNASLGRSLPELVDGLRAAHRLAPLVWDDTLARVAQGHSTDMCRNSFFAHRSPQGSDVLARLAAAHLGYEVAYENLASAPSPAEAFAQWCSSPAHLRALLSDSIRQAGLGSSPSWRDDGSRLYTLVLLRRDGAGRSQDDFTLTKP
jgi:uncharacterized protein YkwD